MPSKNPTLVPCPLCNNECSSIAPSCPQCGHPFVHETSLPKKAVNQDYNPNIWKYLTLIVGLIGAAVLSFFLYNKFYSPSATTLSVASESRTRDLSNTSQNRPITATVPIPTPEENAFLDIETGIDYQVGGVQPITREKFYLLDADLEQILKSAGVKPKSETGILGSFGLGVMYFSNSPDHKRSMEAIKKHVKYSVETDLKGKGKFVDVRPGTYYLFGFTTTRGGFAVWNMKKILNSGGNTEIIDGKNAAIAF